MSGLSFAIGPESALDLRDSSQVGTSPKGELSTVEDLLNAVDPSRPKRFPTIWTAAGHAAECAGVAFNEMPIDMLREIGPKLQIWLKDRRYSAKSISTFLYNLNRLVNAGEEIGCSEVGRKLRESWAPILAAIRKTPNAPRTIIQLAVSKGVPPSLYCDQDLGQWADWMIRRGRQHRTVRLLRGYFRRAVIRQGLEHLLPRLQCRTPSTYKVRVAAMPDPLQSEVLRLLEWKQARFAKGRPQRAKHRPVSAKQLEQYICRLYGYAVGHGGHGQIHCMRELFTEQIVNSFVEWALNTRNMKSRSIMSLSMLYAAIRQYPPFKDIDVSWFNALRDELPEDDESAKLERKAKKYMPYAELRAVADKINAQRRKASADAQLAWLVHDELLIRVLATLVWRQRNMRECKIGDPSTANIFYAPLPNFTHVAKPKWVEDCLEHNPNQSFWQIHFRPEETKTGQNVRGILPLQLVPLLEEYLAEHRSKIAAASDPGTLFVNHDGGALDRQVFTDTVAELIAKHGGVRVTPHVVRDIFAYAWLEAHPEDYLTLSKILWHTTVKYTLSVYGRNFDESNGVRRIDEWLGSR